NTALREQVLQSFAQTAVQTGHAQEAIDVLNANAGTSSKPDLLIERTRAYQAAHQLPRAAKDYQTLFYKFPLADEAKPSGAALTTIMHALRKEYARIRIFFSPSLPSCTRCEKNIRILASRCRSSVRRFFMTPTDGGKPA